jgi:galactose mutarotase-like enzyme
VDIYHLTNDDGIRVSILIFGGIIVTLEVPDRTGRLANVVLGLASLDSYARVSPHFGAVVGRFANRIAGGRFAIDGTTYQLEINNGPNALHGGREGFDKVVWQASVGAGESLTLSYLSRDGEQGYPGNLAVQVTYRAKRHGCSLKGASWSPAHGAQHGPCGTLNVAGAPKEAACVTPSKGLDGSRITRLSATARRRR